MLHESLCRKDIPGLDEAVAASEYAVITGTSFQQVVDKIKSQDLLGVCHEGLWYAEAPPECERALRDLKRWKRGGSLDDASEEAELVRVWCAVTDSGKLFATFLVCSVGGSLKLSRRYGSGEEIVSDELFRGGECRDIEDAYMRVTEFVSVVAGCGAIAQMPCTTVTIEDHTDGADPRPVARLAYEQTGVHEHRLVDKPWVFQSEPEDKFEAFIGSPQGQYADKVFTKLMTGGFGNTEELVKAHLGLFARSLSPVDQTVFSHWSGLPEDTWTDRHSEMFGLAGVHYFARLRKSKLPLPKTVDTLMSKKMVRRLLGFHLRCPQKCAQCLAPLVLSQPCGRTCQGSRPPVGRSAPPRLFPCRKGQMRRFMCTGKETDCICRTRFSILDVSRMEGPSAPSCLRRTSSVRLKISRVRAGHLVACTLSAYSSSFL